MTRSRAWGPGEVSTMQRVISLTVSASGTSVSKRPGVSTTTTSLPLQVPFLFSQCLVMDTGEGIDWNTFSLRMLFPVALFPAPVLPTKTSLSWESPGYASPGTSGNKSPSVRMNFNCLPCKSPAHWINIQPWMFTGRTDAEAEAPILWPPDAKSRLTGKDSDAGKGWRQKEKGWQRVKWLDSIAKSMDMNLSKLQERVENRGTWHAAIHGHDLATEKQ